jgi:hypothetical protein
MQPACRMIEFACRCNHRFSLPEDQAGGLVQCPQCKRLVDVPNLGDLDHIDADGSFKMDEDLIPLAEPDRLERLRRSFTRDRTDVDGADIDLRPTMEDVMKAGTEEMPYELAEEMRPSAPKYDPLTGELVRPLDVKPDDRDHTTAGAVPMAKRAVEYAGSDLNPNLSMARLAIRLLEPVNLFVMLIILVFHFVFQPVSLMMMAGFFLIAPVWIGGIGLLLAHYGNVVEETGPCERDELPRPIRDAGFYDDIWRPLTSVFGAILLCWGILFPALRVGAGEGVLWILFLAGAFLFPAVLLTLVAGGTVLNLRPDRVIGVIKAIGLRYGVVIGLFLAATAAYGLGLWRLHIDSARLFLPRSQSGFSAAIPWWFEAYAAYPALLLGIYLMHGFCWSLGLAYRAYQEQFPWVMRRHIPRRLTDRTRVPDAARRTASGNSAAVRQKLGQ